MIRYLMRVKIHARFATVEDTARALGVPLRRARKLLKLVDSYSRFREAGFSKSKALRAIDNPPSSIEASSASKNGSRPKVISGPLRRKTAKKANASGKKRTRAKAAKASR